MTGKTTLTQTLKKNLVGQKIAIVDWKEHEAQIKATLGTPEEPFDGKVPLGKIEDSIVATIKQDKKAGKRVTYVFDCFPGHPTSTEFAKFVREKLNSPPDHIISCYVPESQVLMQRYKKKIEVEADLSEEQVDQYKLIMQEYNENIESYIGGYAEQYIITGRTKLTIVDTTAASEETVAN